MPVPVPALGLSLLPNIGGWLGSFSTRKAIKDWYPKGTELTTEMTSGSTLQKLGITLIPHIGAYSIGFAFNVRSKLYSDWSKLLKKAPWTPPNYVFGPVWTALYTGMGYASYLVWRDGGGLEGAARWPLTVYAAQLALNWAWTPIMFSYHSVKWALVDITLLSASVGYCGALFYEVNKTAGYLFLPYISWLCIATSLNTYIYLNNPVIPEPKPEKKE